uniref:Uncharacterized protein n=1 Tax=viral metagenome TaxID=1070528 RepID=A0A6M3K541_9ZZZZ
MAIPTVPQQLPSQTQIDLPRIQNPYLSVWWTTYNVTQIPQQSLGWMVSNGWRVTAVVPDPTTVPPTLNYQMTKQGLEPADVLLSLCNSYTIAANEARDANEIRYNEVVANWTEMIDTSHDHFDAQTNEQNVVMGVYLTDLATYMDEINEEMSLNRQELSLAYDQHKETTINRLDNLGQTELARINEEFAASLSVQLQWLVDNGLYTSVVATDIKARNTRDRDDQIQKHYDSLNREKLQNDHLVYGQRTAISEFTRQAIIDKMNTQVARLEGWKSVHADNMRLLAYQLDERNKLLTGLYSFVERRDDISPEWQNMATMIAALGDSAGGWLTP